MLNQAAADGNRGLNTDLLPDNRPVNGFKRCGGLVDPQPFLLPDKGTGQRVILILCLELLHRLDQTEHMPGEMLHTGFVFRQWPRAVSAEGDTRFS